MHLFYSSADVRAGPCLGVLSSGLLWLCVRQAHKLGARKWTVDWLCFKLGRHVIHPILCRVGSSPRRRSGVVAAASRHGPSCAASSALPGLTIFLLFLPWLVYALPRLIGYVSAKGCIRSRDRPLRPCRISLQSSTRLPCGPCRHLRTSARAVGTWRGAGRPVPYRRRTLHGGSSASAEARNTQQPSPDRALLLLLFVPPLARVFFSICDCLSSPTAASA